MQTVRLHTILRRAASSSAFALSKKKLAINRRAASSEALRREEGSKISQIHASEGEAAPSTSYATKDNATSESTYKAASQSSSTDHSLEDTTDSYTLLRDVKEGYHDDRWPSSARQLYSLILDGNEPEAWSLFNQMVKSEKEGESRASIWDWYVMITLVAADSSIPIREVYDLAHWGQVYESTTLYRSLYNKEEFGGKAGQFQIIAFALMHGFHQRLQNGREGDLIETKEMACKEVVSVWETFLNDGGVPTIRHVIKICVALIHLNRMEEAIEMLVKWIEPQDSKMKSIARKGAVQMEAQSLAMLMFALLLEGLPLSAYGMFTTCTGSLYQVEIDQAVVNLLLGNARHAHRGYILSRLMAEETHSAHDVTKLQENLQKWKSQMIWDKVPAALRAARIFKSFLFSHYPELVNEKNPIATDFMSQLHQKTMQAASAYYKEASTMSFSDVSARKKSKVSRVFAENFDQYLRILPFVYIYEKVPWEEYSLVLAWMKKLDIKPNYFTLMRVIWATDRLDISGGKSSKAQSLHEYLADWIGEDNIPSTLEVHRFIQKQRKSYWIEISDYVY